MRFSSLLNTLAVIPHWHNAFLLAIHVIARVFPSDALQEFFALADFVCPGLLSPSLAVFNRVYGAPIAAAQDRNASEEQRRIGEDRQR